MALKLNFREVTPEDTEILRMIALRNGKAEDYLCCDVTNEDGVTQTTWYSKADVALWGEDYIRANMSFCCWSWPPACAGARFWHSNGMTSILELVPSG